MDDYQLTHVLLMSVLVDTLLLVLVARGRMTPRTGARTAVFMSASWFLFLLPTLALRSSLLYGAATLGSAGAYVVGEYAMLHFGVAEYIERAERAIAESIADERAERKRRQ